MQCAEGSLIITYPYHGGVLFATFSLEKSYGCMLVSSNIIRVQCTLGWIHFWQIHVGPSASVHSEMNTLRVECCSLRSRSQAASRPSACGRCASSQYEPCLHVSHASNQLNWALASKGPRSVYYFCLLWQIWQIYVSCFNQLNWTAIWQN